MSLFPFLVSVHFLLFLAVIVRGVGSESWHTTGRYMSLHDGASIDVTGIVRVYDMGLASSYLVKTQRMLHTSMKHLRACSRWGTGCP